MTSWRERILQAFVPEVARLTLVADPDALLSDEGIQADLVGRGFDVLAVGDDPMGLRFLYESRYRSRWDRGERTADLVVVVPGDAHALRALPWDLLQTGRILEFALGDLFPGLSTPVVAELNRADFDRLDAACQQHRPAGLGASATRDFILRHVFGIAPETMTEPHELLRALLQMHFAGRQLPPVLADRWVMLLRQGERFPGWPLEAIVSSREAFIAYLQERWPAFVQERVDQRSGALPADQRPVVREPERPRWSAQQLPFDHPDVRVYVDNLFVEGLLQPAEVTHADLIAGQAEWRNDWAALGLRLDAAAIRQQRMERLLGRIETALPEADARHGDWQAFAALWAEFLVLMHQDGDPAEEQQARFLTLRDQLDTRFLAWMQTRYAGLHNQASTAPVMLHHVPRALARQMEAGQVAKVALLLVDGLALDQWAVLRGGIASGAPELRLEEGSVFSWVPTLTPVARQAAFAGRPPMFFADSIGRTDKDGARWRQFWEARGIPGIHVRYEAGIRDESDLARVEAAASHPQVRVLGLVVDTVDRTMHGMQHGSAGMHDSMRHWNKNGYLRRLLNLLLGHGFTVFLTSDHGNVEARGIGRPSEGASADTRGERVRIYTDALLREQTRAAFPDTIVWDSAALPAGFLPLLAPARSAFVPRGERVVSHGGISLEEVVVPFVRITQQES
jgi:hypothetical protein